MRRRGVEEAWNSLEDMQRQGTTTDKYTVSRMLMKTVGDGRTKLNPPKVYRAISLVERFIEMQPRDVDEVLFNALLDTCCRLKDLSRLEATVQRMHEFKVAPSPVTLGILVKTYGQAGDIQKVLQVWSEMEKQRDQANAVTYGCMIDACVKCGHLEKAIEIFQGMRKVGKHRNTILYTTLIKGYGLEKDLASALELFREMPQEGVPYNTITYNSILDACIKSGDLSTAEALLREMTSTESSLEPDLITFSTLLKGYCHIGNLEKALQVAEAIKARGLRCDELVYNTLMDGCVKANDITAGVGLFEEMVQSGMRPSTITHSILSKLYQHAGYEDATEMVAQLYQHHGIERPSGSERGKGGGRRFNPRSPGRGTERAANQSPLGSPSAATSAPSLGFGGFAEGVWNTMGSVPPMPGAECAPSEHSAPSTPLRSPLQASHVNGSTSGPYLPIESLRGAHFVPPLPGSGGPAGSPYSLASCTPVGSLPPASFAGSVAGSPCATTGMEQGFAVPASPQPMPPGCGQVGPYVSATMPGAMPQLPPWPLTCGTYAQSAATAPAMPPSGRPGGEVCMQPMMAMAMMQAAMAGMPSPHIGAGGSAPGGACGSFGPSLDAAQMVGPASPLPLSTPGHAAGHAGLAAGAGQSPYQMSLAQQHELSFGTLGQHGQPKAYFETFMHSSQPAGGTMQIPGGAQMGAGMPMASGPSAPAMFLT